MRQSSFPLLTTTATTSLTTVAAETSGGMLNQKWYDITSAGAGTLNDFQLQAQFYIGGPWRTLLAAADWSAIAGGGNLPWFLLGVGSSRPDTLANNGATYVGVNLPGVYAYRFQAKAASGTAAITVAGHGRAES